MQIAANPAKVRNCFRYFMSGPSKSFLLFNRTLDSAKAVPNWTSELVIRNSFIISNMCLYSRNGAKQKPTRDGSFPLQLVVFHHPLTATPGGGPLNQAVTAPAAPPPPEMAAAASAPGPARIRAVYRAPYRCRRKALRPRPPARTRAHSPGDIHCSA
jgi:hypothetical protein